MKICKCGAVMVTKQGNIGALLGTFVYGEYTYCPEWKWWQFSGHTLGESKPFTEGVKKA